MDGDWKLEAGRLKLETGNLKLEAATAAVCKTLRESHKKAQKGTKRQNMQPAGSAGGSAGLLPRFVTSGWCKQQSFQFPVSSFGARTTNCAAQRNGG